MELREQILAAFKEDGIALHPMSGEGTEFDPPPDGVSLELGPDADPRDVEVVGNALLKANLVTSPINFRHFGPKETLIKLSLSTGV